MPTPLSAMFPVIALIAAGALFGTFRRIGDAGVAALNGFTVWLALPALLFRSLAAGDGSMLAQPGFVAAFAVGAAVTFAIALAASRAGDLAGRVPEALAASYSNTAFIGLPLMEGLLGRTGTTAAVIASLLTVSLLFAIAVLLIEIGRTRAGDGRVRIGRVARALLRNPLVLSPVAGGLWGLGGWTLPAQADRVLTLLAAAAAPCALVTIGAFLALRRGDGGAPGTARTVALKLVVQPMVTAAAVLMLPMAGMALARDWQIAAVMLAALPSGTGPFMLAELYGRGTALAARAILLSTLLGAGSVWLLATALLR